METTNYFIRKYFFIIAAFALTLWESNIPLEMNANYASLFDFSKFGHTNRSIIETVSLFIFLYFFYQTLKIQKADWDFKKLYFLAASVFCVGLFISLFVKHDLEGIRVFTYSLFITSMFTIDLILWGKNEIKINKEKKNKASSDSSLTEEVPIGV
jgi:uncharacterized membrane protein